MNSKENWAKGRTTEQIKLKSLNEKGYCPFPTLYMPLSLVPLPGTDLKAFILEWKHLGQRSPDTKASQVPVRSLNEAIQNRRKVLRNSCRKALFNGVSFVKSHLKILRSPARTN